MHKEVRKWMGVVMVVALVALSACAGPATPTAATPTPGGEATPVPEKATPAPPTEEKVSITFCTHSYEPWKETLLKWIDEYTAEHPNVEISYVSYPMEDQVMKLVTGWEAGTGETVIGIYGPWLASMVDGGYLDPAPDWAVEQVKEDYYPIGMEGSSIEGKLYGVMQHMGTPLPILSVDAYEAAGIPESEYPDTYDDLLALLPRLDKKAADGTWEVQGICLPTFGPFQMIDWASPLFSYGGKILDDTGTKAAFNTPEGLEATKVFRKLHYPDADINMFPLGKCGMWWYGSWSRPMWTGVSPDLRVKVLRPLAGPAGRFHANYTWSWVVNAHASPAQKEAGWDFVKHITTKKAYLELWNAVSLMPARKSAYEDPSIKDDEFLQAFGKSVPDTVIYYPPIAKWEPVEAAITRLLERVTAGELSEQDFLNQAEQEVNSILAGE